MDRPLHLTDEQQLILNLAKKGHNICILGRAGVGKSTTVQEIEKALSAQGKKCQTVCSTGIACQNYGGIAKTVHSFYGLQMAEFPSQELVERSVVQEKIRKNVNDTDVLIWDEISMSSCRFLELVNMIHHLISDNNFAFGGIQVILVGDFWQLKPVPSVFDEGKAMYESKIFDEAFQHRIELTKILRQSDMRFKNWLDMLRIGECSEEGEEYAQCLDREIATEEGNEPTHIYFRKVHVEFHNGTVLASLPGGLIYFQSVDTGNLSGLEKNIPKIVAVKPGCKIMLLYNINDNLKNGCQGEFVSSDPEDENKILVSFPTAGTVSLNRRTWIKYAPDGSVQGTRTQFPIIPCYAITVHKSQGLTLNSAVVHCSQEFVHGLTYVAMSRVKSPNNLRVINFHRKFLLPQELVNLARTVTLEPDDTYACCRYRPLDTSHFVNVDSIMQLEEQSTEVTNEDFETDANSDDGIEREEYFETSEATATCPLEDVLLCLIPHFQTELSTPPATFTMLTFLTSIITKHSDSYSEAINAAAKYAIDNLETFQLLGSILWCRIVLLFEQHLADNPETINITNKDFTCATSGIHELFLSREYRKDLKTAFSVKELTVGQRTLGAQLVFHLYQILTVEIDKKVKKVDAKPIDFNVTEMEDVGLGKVRHVGAWAIRKCLDKSRRYCNS